MMDQQPKEHSDVPIRDYAVIGDGRTMALVARNGSVDWLCLPDLDSPSVFGALLDRRRGGRATLAPEVAHRAERRYLPETNVLETTFTSSEGAVRVTEALTLPGSWLAPQRELARRIEGLSGTVPMGWSVAPRFGYGRWRTRIGWRSGVPVAAAGNQALAVCTWNAGRPTTTDGSISGHFQTSPGSRALVTLCATEQEPLVLPARAEVEQRLDATVTGWQRWAHRSGYDGPWPEAVARSALALKLLVFAPSGALAAAATTSLPEGIGGVRNWDYRFCWVRDSAFILNAFLQLGFSTEVDAFFWWLMQASQLTHPRLQVLYRLNGGASATERTIGFEGYRGSVPVRVGNAAADQVQLDVYGDLLQTAWLYVRSGRKLDREIGRRLEATANLVCDLWREPDSGIWEVRSAARHFTQSKMMCWVALDRAVRLAGAGQIPAAHVGRWEAEAAAVRAFVDEHCWSEAKGSYTRSAGSDEVDASLLLGVLFGFADPKGCRARGTIDAVRRELGHGPFLYRYSGKDGLTGSEGAFLTCSFWLADALARSGQEAEAAALMETLLGLANDVGLYAEEVDPGTGEFLGNFPQGLTHLALVNAAVAIDEERRR
ncbi:MAG TPA: glycoside hydrolase family 15 protein [Acidimicrobiia bacterium]|nr:glycoside hydrolase family 15 protein [Acidimicrobiia bacterium]